MRVADNLKARVWHITNPTKQNRLGQNVGYALHPEGQPVLLQRNGIRRASSSTSTSGGGLPTTRGFKLKPVGFFDRNPALNVPGTKPAHCCEDENRRPVPDENHPFGES
jgi:Cu2+-containing amine oxidase